MYVCPTERAGRLIGVKNGTSELVITPLALRSY